MWFGAVLHVQSCNCTQEFRSVATCTAINSNSSSAQFQQFVRSLTQFDAGYGLGFITMLKVGDILSHRNRMATHRYDSRGGHEPPHPPPRQADAFTHRSSRSGFPARICGCFADVSRLFCAVSPLFRGCRT
eukprot:3724515-Prymnesium_polylepis.1